MKSPVVEVEAVEADAVDMANADLAVDAMFSDLESDSEDSDWDNLSNCDDAIQILRDDQIRDGLGKSPPFTPDPRSRRSRWANAGSSPRRLYFRGGDDLSTTVACDRQGSLCGGNHRARNRHGQKALYRVWDRAPGIPGRRPR